jgi:hypothetical protein
MHAVGAFGKILIITGVLFVLAGVIALAADRLPWLGRLPGDITIRRDGFTLYFPLASSILVSIVLSLLLYLFRR